MTYYLDRKRAEILYNYIATAKHSKMIKQTNGQCSARDFMALFAESEEEPWRSAERIGLDSNGEVRSWILEIWPFEQDGPLGKSGVVALMALCRSKDDTVYEWKVLIDAISDAYYSVSADGKRDRLTIEGLNCDHSLQSICFTIVPTDADLYCLCASED